MFKVSFFVLLMSACAKPIPPVGGILGVAGENFASTNSLCMDGAIVAIDHSCAVPMIIEHTGPYIMMQCSEVRANMPPWHEYNTIVIVDPDIPDPPAANMACVDPHARVYIQKRP